MGNQLAAAVAVNVADVSPSFELIAPLGVQHGSFFRSFRCVRTIDAPTAAEIVRYRRPNAGAKIHTNIRESAGGLDVVVKVFVRVLEDSAQHHLIEHCYGHLLDLQERITQFSPGAAVDGGGPCNVLFYSAMEIQNDRFCMLQRSFVAFSLVERLATRPYWDHKARLFAGYQLLRALVQLHEQWGTVHGDLKTNNVLVDAAGWLYVTDLSPFKPARLPANNPALFDYYYDTSETRICFLDPDKFIDQPITFAASNANTTGHTQAMDIFSAACVLAHVFTEEPLFRLSEVLGMRAMATQNEREAYVGALLADRSVPLALRQMLLVMLCTPAAERPSARQLLERFTPSVFPRYFAFLYGDVLAPLLARPPDLQAQLLRARFDDILDEACRRESHGNDPNAHTEHSIHKERDSNNSDPNEVDAPEDNARRTTVLLLLPIVFRAVLHALTADGVCRALSVLQRALPHCPVDVQTDAILPHVLHCVREDRFPVVARLFALRVLASICDSASAAFASSEAMLFDDLVLPCVEDLVARSPSRGGPLLCEAAAVLPRLLRLTHLHLQRRQCVAARAPFGAQRTALLERGWEAVRPLLTHSDPAVAIEALRGAPDTAAFLGEERTQDDLVPLLTTLIVSTVDVQRELHARAIACLAALQAPRLRPLQFFVDEGLRHADVMVLQRTLGAIAGVVASRRVPVWDAMEFVYQALPHVLSANAWVRAAVCRLVEDTVRTHRTSDVWAHLECAVRPLLRQPVPLANMTQFPAVIKAEIAYGHITVVAGGSEGARVLGGDADAHTRIVGSAASGRAPRYAVPSYVVKRTLHGLITRVPCVDVTLDSTMLPNPREAENSNENENMNEEGHKEGLEKVDAPWRLFIRPTPREMERLCMRKQAKVPNKRNNKNNVIMSDVYSDALYGTGSVALPWDSAPLHTSSLWTGDRALEPVAAPWLSRAAHRGGIYCAASSRDGTLVTAGARGEAMLWSLGTSGLDYAHRVDCGAASSSASTLLFATFLREGTNALLCLGGTDGALCVHDIPRDAIVSRRSLDGSALRAAVCLSPEISLVTSAAGGLFAVDHRCAASDVWRAAVPPEFGAPVGLVPLPPHFRGGSGLGSGLGSGGPSAAAVAASGGAVLFDLRFQLLLRTVPCGARVLCAAPDPNGLRQILLGTQAGPVLRVDFAAGDAAVALQPVEAAATRVLLTHSAHGVVFTAGDDRRIRRWSVAAPGLSRTISCPPYASPPYVGTVRMYVAEMQAQGTQRRMAAEEIARGDIPRHHKDAILTLCVANCGGTPHLVSGARDGTLIVWHNAD